MKSPDFIIYLSNEQDNVDSAPAPKAKASAPPKRTPQPASVDSDDDGIPM
jgi:hypothetical protein